VQVQEQADVQRAPVVAEQVVQGGPVPGELLLVAGAQDADLGVNDASRAVMLCTRAR